MEVEVAMAGGSRFAEVVDDELVPNEVTAVDDREVEDNFEGMASPSRNEFTPAATPPTPAFVAPPANSSSKIVVIQ